MTVSGEIRTDLKTRLRPRPKRDDPPSRPAKACSLSLTSALSLTTADAAANQLTKIKSAILDDARYLWLPLYWDSTKAKHGRRHDLLERRFRVPEGATGQLQGPHCRA